VSECQKIVADGLGLLDLLAIEGTIFIATNELEAYPNTTYREPPIMWYAEKDTPE
jgi:hypothetical protein